MKPYAYAVVQGEDDRENVSLQFDHPEMCGQTYRQAIPLFANLPKELTDEDILEEWTCKYSECYQDTLIDFARAILRKAKEK